MNLKTLALGIAIAGLASGAMVTYFHEREAQAVAAEIGSEASAASDATGAMAAGGSADVGTAASVEGNTATAGHDQDGRASAEASVEGDVEASGGSDADELIDEVTDTGETAVDTAMDTEEEVTNRLELGADAEVSGDAEGAVTQ
ncbi:hypothetical protein GCM10007160_20680 [Litchfieldella qijiaojingensis]|uniref:Uncharacterized protein n=1 Tax=Litchfieldella qijiaojingensis TaxID=980347 RepID=A0ABQ2YRL8_9GAMM|nr:hypothetical protein [Halomonas qijiaojingensis]GGX93006.1 hypothetical protein GCM10007160_20680 [Halomonas qijiaojingensis]